MSDFEFEFPETLPNEHLNFIEETCIYWIPTFKIKKNYSKEERIAKYRQIVNRDIKNEIGENEDILNATTNALDFYEKMITE